MPITPPARGNGNAIGRRIRALREWRRNPPGTLRPACSRGETVL